jgi:hypothetical protein
MSASTQAFACVTSSNIANMVTHLPVSLFLLVAMAALLTGKCDEQCRAIHCREPADNHTNCKEMGMLSNGKPSDFLRILPAKFAR